MKIDRKKLLSTKIERYSDEVYRRNCKNFVSLGRGGSLITGSILIMGLVFSNYTEFVFEYGLFFLYMVALYLIALLCQQKKVKHIKLAYYLSITPIMLGGIMMGTFLDPKDPAITIIIMICIMLLFIIDKPLRILIYILSIAGIFTICAYIAKPWNVYTDDMFDLLVFTCVALGINYFTLKDRIECAENYCTAQARSEHDTLTTLLNRGSGEKQARNLVENNIPGMFAIIDVDDFKSFNDIYGHQVGDEVISVLAREIKGIFRNQDIIFRLGGDEFAIYAPNLIQHEICEEHFERLSKKLKEVNLSIKKERPIQISIGCTICQSTDVDFEALYKKSDELLYEAKKNGKGQMVLGTI